MRQYKLDIPKNYQEICSLGAKVSTTIENRKIPNPTYIARVLGEEAVPAYYFMHALGHSIEQGRVRGILDYARRDAKAIQMHSFDAAFKPYYRLIDKRLPSKYTLKQRGTNGVLVHDLGEEFGQSLLGASVVNDVIRYLLGDVTGSDADNLTNKNALLLDPLIDELGRANASAIDHESVYPAFEKLRSGVKTETDRVLAEYQRISDALNSFRQFVYREVDYMPDAEKRQLVDIINKLSLGVERKIRDGILETRILEQVHDQQYGHVMGIMNSGRYIPVNRRLLLPGDNEFLLTLKKTFYVDFLDNIAQRVKYEALLAHKNGSPNNDGYLELGIEKLAENTDTVAKGDPMLLHAISIFRKSSLLMARKIALAEYLTETGIRSERLLRGVDYLHRNQVAIIDENLQSLKSANENLSESSYKTPLEKYVIMKEIIEEREYGKKIKDLERVVRSMEKAYEVSAERRGFLEFAKNIALLGLTQRKK